MPFELILPVNTPDPIVGQHVRALAASMGDERIQVIDSSQRRGAAHARNAGVEHTDAAVVAFCDADDLVHAGWLAALVAAVDTHDAATGRVVDVFPDERHAAWHPPTTPDGLPTFLGRPYVLSGNLAVRRAAFNAVGGFDETLSRCEDIALGWALQREGFTLGYAPDAVLDYRHRSGLRPMLVQHYRYGRGMSEVIRRYGVAAGDTLETGSALRSLRPNAQRARTRTAGGLLRRTAIAAGRVRGLLSRSPRGAS